MSETTSSRCSCSSNRAERVGEGLGDVVTGGGVQAAHKSADLSSRRSWETLQIRSARRSPAATFQPGSTAQYSPVDRDRDRRPCCAAQEISFASEKRRMQFDAGQIRDPHQRRQIVRQNVIDVAMVAFAPDRRRLHPVRPMFGGILLEKSIPRPRRRDSASG